MIKVYIIIVSIFFISCQKERTVKTESWIKQIPENKNIREELIFERHFRLNSSIEKEIYWRVSKSVFKKMIVFDSPGNKRSEIIISDSAGLNVIRTFFKYPQDELIKRTIISYQNGHPLDTMQLTIIDSFNQNGLKESTFIIHELTKDTNYIYYRYNSEGLIEKRITIINKEIFSSEKFEYNSLNKVAKHEINIPKHDLSKIENNFYLDTLIDKRVTIENNDTVLIEKFYYFKGLRNRIVRKNLKKNKTEVIFVKYEYW